MSDIVMPEPPVRLCCMQRHWGATCPDGRVMCCVCFEKVEPDKLCTDPVDGKKFDVCHRCARHIEGFNLGACKTCGYPRVSTTTRDAEGLRGVLVCSADTSHGPDTMGAT